MFLNFSQWQSSDIFKYIFSHGRVQMSSNFIKRLSSGLKIISTPEFSCILISLNARVQISLNFFRVRFYIFIKQFQCHISLDFFLRQISNVFIFLSTPQFRYL